MPLLGLLGILFVGLKLTGHVDWSWVFVTMPFWIGAAIMLVLASIAGVIVITNIITTRGK